MLVIKNRELNHFTNLSDGLDVGVAKDRIMPAQGPGNQADKLRLLNINDQTPIHFNIVLKKG